MILSGTGTAAPATTNPNGTVTYSDTVKFGLPQNPVAFSQHGSSASADNTNGNQTPGTATYSLTVTPVLRWRNQDDSNEGTTTAPKNVVYRIRAHAYSGTQAIPATPGTSDADNGLGDLKTTPRPGNTDCTDCMGDHRFFYNNSAHDKVITLSSFTMTASATGGYDANGDGLAVYARTDIFVYLGSAGLSWPRGDGTVHRPTGDGLTTTAASC